MTWTRYVALGDSTSEGLNDPYPDGSGFRGFTDRLAERLATVAPSLGYANLAVRGRLVRDVVEEQLEPALELRPDIVTVVAGLNDALRRTFDADAVHRDLDTIVGELRATGATVATINYPDPAPICPLAVPIRPRLAALNAAVRDVAARHGAVVVDVESSPIAGDRRFWHADRMHPNTEGHMRMAGAFAHALGLPGADASWSAPLPPAERRARRAALVDDAAWAGRHLLPWVVRRLRGVSSGDGVTPKRPVLTPVLGWDGGQGREPSAPGARA